jgi:hypothetical protein
VAAFNLLATVGVFSVDVMASLSVAGRIVSLLVVLGGSVLWLASTLFLFDGSNEAPVCLWATACVLPSRIEMSTILQVALFTLRSLVWSVKRPAR